jgi:predicted dehydrogenase
MQRASLSLIVDRDAERAAAASAEFQAPSVTHYGENLNAFDAAVIAVPTTDHFEIASDLISAGKHVLIEKPVTSTIDQAQKLARLLERSKVVAHVGFPERFNPAVRRSLPQITRPLFIECHRLGQFSPRSLDVDVVLDLMIHDLDLLHLFLKEEPSDIEAVGIPILSHNIDIANVRLKFPGKCVVNLTASRVSAKRMRKMRLFQPYYYLSMDFVEQSVSMFSLQPDPCAGEVPQINHIEYKPEQKVHPLENELSAFCDAIEGHASDGVTVADSISSLVTALAIKGKFSIPEL